MFAIWTPLWYGDAQGVFQPGLASELPSTANGGISADLTTWTIHLRSGLKWSDGSPLTADDCAFTFNLGFDPALGGLVANIGPGTAAYADGPVPFVSAAAVDTTTVRVQLSHRDVGFLAFVADSPYSCIPKKIFGNMTATQISASPESFQPTIVSGPFKVKEHVAGDHLTLVRNPYYYQAPDKPYLDQVIFKYLQGDTLDALFSEEFSGVQAHAIDVAAGVDSSRLASYRAIAGYTTSLSPNSNFEVLAFNLTDPILSDHAVRQAITMSIDRNKIIQIALNGAGTLTCDDDVGTFAHEASLACYPFDLTGANRLLESDGWAMGADGYRHKNGQPLDLEYATTDAPERAAAQQVIRDDLKAIGMKIDLKVYTEDDLFGTSGSATSSGATGLLATGHYQITEWSSNNLYEPNDYDGFDSASTPGPFHGDVMRYANPEVDRLLADQAATADVNARKADFHIIHADILKDLPVMYLYANLGASCVRSDLHNYDPSHVTAETWNIADWWLGSNAG